MKKRFLSALLAVAVFASLMMGISLSASAARQIIIDDLGTETATAVTLSHFFTCLNERLLRQKSVIISTNLSLEDCRNRYQDRIFSRIASNFEFCKLTGPDIRMCKKVSAVSGPVR